MPTLSVNTEMQLLLQYWLKLNKSLHFNQKILLVQSFEKCPYAVSSALAATNFIWTCAISYLWKSLYLNQGIFPNR